MDSLHLRQLDGLLPGRGLHPPEHDSPAVPDAGREEVLGRPAALLPLAADAQYSPIVVCSSTLPSGYVTIPTISIFGSLGFCRLRYQAITPTKEQMAMASRSYDSVSKHFYRQVQLGLQYPRHHSGQPD